MAWHDQLNDDPLPWLLADDAPGVRYLALRDLMDRPADDAELVEARRAAHREGPIAAILAEMDPLGFWGAAGPGYWPKYRSTVWSVVLLAQLGALVKEDPRISQACTYLLDNGLTEHGQFSASGAPSGTADCLQGNLCWALASLGCDDPRLEAAYHWMARSVTGEGVAPLEDKKAPVRYYAGNCGPTFSCGSNLGLPCAWGAVKIMQAFGVWPPSKRSLLLERAIRHGVKFLFSVDPVTADYPAGFTGKPSRNWWKFGFPVFYVTDLLQLVEALAVLGWGDDPRLERALDCVREKQDEQGRWALEYDYAGKTWVDFGPKRQPNKWVTLRALRALKAADHPPS